MAFDPWLPESAVGPARGVGPAPIGTTTPFANVNNRGGFYGGVAGTLASAAIPGAGFVGTGIGTGFDVRNANNQLSSLGLDRSVAFGPSFANNMTFGLMGKSPRDQFQDAVTRAYPGLLQALTPAPPVQEAPPAWEGTPSQGYFDAINDLGTVGNLGATLDARGVPGGYQGDAGGAAANGGADYGPSAQAEAERGGYEGSGMYRTGGYVPHDGDSRMEPVRATLHEGEFVIRPEAVDKVGIKNLQKLNSAASPRVMARLLREMK